MYAILKLNADLILSLDSKKDILTKIRENSKQLKINQVLKLAFELKMKTSGMFGKTLKYQDTTAEYMSQKVQEADESIKALPKLDVK